MRFAVLEKEPNMSSLHVVGCFGRIYFRAGLEFGLRGQRKVRQKTEALETEIETKAMRQLAETLDVAAKSQEAGRDKP